MADLRSRTVQQTQIGVSAYARCHYWLIISRGNMRTAIRFSSITVDYLLRLVYYFASQGVKNG